MFNSVRKFLGIKKKSAGAGEMVARARGWQSLHAFAKGQDFENAYPHISRIASEFMAIRPYGIDVNGKPVKQSRVLDAIYHPNLDMSSADFRETLATMLLVHSKVYILAWREENGRAVAGGEITPQNIAGFTFLENVSESWRGDEKIYRVGAREYTTREVIEIKGGVNPYNLGDGFSPAAASRKWATLDDYIASYQAGLFENGAVPAGEFVITAASPKEFNEIVDTLQAKHRGSGRNNNIVYTHAPIDPATGKPMNSQIEWIPYSVPNNQLGLGEIFSQVNKKIDSSFGVPASVRGVNEGNTYASVRIDEQVFLKYTIKPFALRIWTRFTHELNRITGGIGFFITFDLDEVGVADEEKAQAEKKSVELGIIREGLGLGYSLESIVEAFDLSNAYKLLKIGEMSGAEIQNDKPEVDEGGEVENLPTQFAQKYACGKCGGGHEGYCLKESSKTKTAKNQKDIDVLAGVYRDLIDAQIEKALNGKSKKSAEVEEVDFNLAALNEKERAEYESRAMAILMSLALAGGVQAWRKLVSVLAQNGVSGENLTKFEISENLRETYAEAVQDFTLNFSQDTAGEIARAVKAGLEQGENKSEISARIRTVKPQSEWRVQRIARTETHRARGLGGVEAAVQIQNESGARIYKIWQVLSPSPCGWCAAMNGTRVNVAESYVKKGGIIISKSKVRINDYQDIDTAGLHPNCSCIEKFEIEEGVESEVFDFSKLPRTHAEFLEVHEQDFFERLTEKYGNVRRIPLKKGTPTYDFEIIESGKEWELKSILVDKLGKSTVRNEIFKATDAGKDRIFIDIYNKKINAKDVVDAAAKHISIEKNNKLIKELVVVKDDTFVKIK